MLVVDSLVSQEFRLEVVGSQYRVTFSPLQVTRQPRFDSNTQGTSLPTLPTYIPKINNPSPAEPPRAHPQPVPYKMSKTVQISSAAQFSDLLKSSRVVVTDCKCAPPAPLL
jgi:hypothetical protein